MFIKLEEKQYKPVKYKGYTIYYNQRSDNPEIPPSSIEIRDNHGKVVCRLDYNEDPKKEIDQLPVIEESSKNKLINEFKVTEKSYDGSLPFNNKILTDLDPFNIGNGKYQSKYITNYGNPNISNKEFSTIVLGYADSTPMIYAQVGSDPDGFLSFSGYSGIIKVTDAYDKAKQAFISATNNSELLTKLKSLGFENR